jgi:hypothetical protein
MKSTRCSSARWTCREWLIGSMISVRQGNWTVKVVSMSVIIFWQDLVAGFMIERFSKSALYPRCRYPLINAWGLARAQRASRLVLESSVVDA